MTTAPSGKAKGPVCCLHGTHRPRPLQLVVHHVQPRGMGGPDVPENRRTVCDTGHRNVHRIMVWLCFGGQDPGGTETERAMAREGYAAWLAAGKPGSPHAAYAVHGPPAGPDRLP